MRPTSDDSKKANGTYRPAVARPPLGVPTGCPKAPHWLSAEGLAHWKQVVPVLNKSGVLTEADATALGQMCELTAELASDPRGFPTGKHKELRMLSAEFGCTISSRLKMKAPEGIKPQENELCPPKQSGKVVSISRLLSGTPKASPTEASQPADTSAAPASDS